MIAKDTIALGEMLDDSFVLVHMTGLKQAKNEYLRAISTGTLNYYSCDNTELEWNEREESATEVHLTGRSKVNAAVFGGGRHTWPLQLDIDMIWRDGRWKITKIKASTY